MSGSGGGGPDLWFDISLPAPILGVDVINTMLGLDLDAILAPTLRAPVFVEGGQKFYPCHLPADDNGFVIPLRSYGALGFKAHKGKLAVFLPPGLQQSWEARVPVEVRGKGVTGHINNSPSIGYLMRLEPGAAARLDLPLIGFLGIRLAPQQPRMEASPAKPRAGS